MMGLLRSSRGRSEGNAQRMYVVGLREWTLNDNRIRTQVGIRCLLSVCPSIQL
jgi:hypothetical protein